MAAGLLFVFLGLALLLRAISGNLPDRLLAAVGVEPEPETTEDAGEPETKRLPFPIQPGPDPHGPGRGKDWTTVAPVDTEADEVLV